MGIVIRQSLKGSLVSFGGIFLSAISILWLYPRFLTREEIGIITFLEAVAWTFLSFGSLGVFNISDRFLPYFKTDDFKHRGYLSFLLIYLGLGFLLVLLVLLGFKEYWISIYAPNAPRATEFFYYLIPFIFSLLLMSLGESYARIHLRIVVPSIFKEFLIKGGILLSLFLYGFHLLNFEELIALRILVFALASLGILAYLRHLGVLKFQNPLPFLRKNRPLLREIITYGSFIMIGGMSNLVIAKIDILMIPAFLGSSELGIYAIAFFIGTIIEVPRKAIGQISTPLIAKAWAEKNYPEIQKMYRSSALNQYIAGLFLFLIIWPNAPDIFHIIPNGEKFQSGLSVIFLIGLTRLVDMVTGLNNEILLQSQYYKFNLIALILLAILNIGLNYYWLPQYGISGAAMATLVAFILFNFVKCLFIWWKFRMQPFSGGILGVSLIGGLSYLSLYLLPSTNSPYLDIIIRSTCMLTLFMGLILVFKVSPELKELENWLKEMANKRFGKNRG